MGTVVSAVVSVASAVHSGFVSLAHLMKSSAASWEGKRASAQEALRCGVTGSAPLFATRAKSKRPLRYFWMMSRCVPAGKPPTKT
eukprot:2981568-Prorocentrum_lima.AAC.1